MDDESWDFFCNNSPQLVEIPRTRTPLTKKSGKGLSDSKSSLRNLFISKPASKINETSNKSKDKYRDSTPPILINRSSSKLASKPVQLVKEVEGKEIKKEHSPIGLVKRKVFLSKRLNYLRKGKIGKITTKS